MLRRLRAGAVLLLILAPALGRAGETVRPFTFAAIDGRTYDSWQLLGMPLVVNVGSHF